MKREYKICILSSLVELAVIFVLDKTGIRFSSLFFHAVGALLFLLPIVALFFFMSKDETFSPKLRILFKVIYLFLGLCYIGGLIAKITI